MSEHIEVIPLHFNVRQHYLPLYEFIETAKSTRTIINNFNQVFLDGKLQYQIFVLPPEPGTFKSRLGLMIIASAAFFGTALGPEMVSGFIKGVTGESPGEFSQDIGHKIKEYIDSVGPAKPMDKDTAGKFLSLSTQNFLQKETDSLRKVGISTEQFRPAYQARNDFYNACYGNPEIKAIGFDETDNFPISRTDFPRYIIDDLPPVPESENDPPHNWRVAIEYIKVTSPNWERGDDRHWKAKYDGNKAVWLVIEDEIFWRLIDTKNLIPKIVDTLKVQWAFEAEKKGRKTARVLRVLEYNGTKISEPLSDDELNTILQTHSQVHNAQGDLFDKL